jgi:hypothetical protein
VPTDPLIVDLSVLRAGEWVSGYGSTARRSTLDVQGADPGEVWRWTHVRDRLQDGDRRASDPAGDRVQIVMSEKFLPYKVY